MRRPAQRPRRRSPPSDSPWRSWRLAGSLPHCARWRWTPPDSPELPAGASTTSRGTPAGPSASSRSSRGSGCRRRRRRRPTGSSRKRCRTRASTLGPPASRSSSRATVTDSTWMCAITAWGSPGLASRGASGLRACRSVRGSWGAHASWGPRRAAARGGMHRSHRTMGSPQHPAPAPLRVLIVDDHPMVREGLRSMLEPAGVEVVGEAGTGEDALRLAATTAPDVVLLDLELPDVDGLAVLQRLRTLARVARVLVITMHDDPALVRRAVEGGASGYVLKGVGRRELLSALATGRHGRCVVGPLLLA